MTVSDEKLKSPIKVTNDVAASAEEEQETDNAAPIEQYEGGSSDDEWEQ